MSQGSAVRSVELVWDGKYADDGSLVVPPRVNLPFQMTEAIYKKRTGERAYLGPQQMSILDLWDPGSPAASDQWSNKLIWGDNLLVMSSLLEQFAGKIDLIYIDPPYLTGADFSVWAPIGDEGDLGAEKRHSLVEEKAYRDTWGRGTSSYLQMMADRLRLMRELLAPTGSLFVHVDYRMASNLRLILDEVFGSDRLVNEIIWCKFGPGAPGMRQFNRKHDNIFWYAKSDAWKFNADAVRVPYHETTAGKFQSAGTGFGGTTADLTKGKVPETWWSDIPIVQRIRTEIAGYETQKPLKLLKRIITAASDEGDLVADFFAGSGTTCLAAESLNRRWIGSDMSRYAIHVTRKRLLDLGSATPVDVLNLGKYERQYWQRAWFGDRDTQERVVFEYLAFILRLYGASPIPGAQHLHGKKGGAVVHIGAVDAPVTIAEVEASLDEAAATGQSELHVLGWEWEMGLNDLVNQLAQQRRVRLKLLAIPREVMEAQAVDRGDIRFFELAHLDAALETGPKCALSVRLADFAMSDADLIPEDVRDKITKWSDYVDYWAIDWDFRNDTFMNGWVAYRTRRDRKLPLESDRHTYAEPGTYQVAVKVVDIFGNDTTRVFPVEVGE